MTLLGLEIPIFIVAIAGSVALLAISAIVFKLTLVPLFKGFYKKSSPSKALVVYGRKETRVVFNGGGTFIWPFTEEVDEFDLTIKTVDIEKDVVPVSNGTPINVWWVAQVQPIIEEAPLKIAIRAFLGKEPQKIQQIIAETLSANFRSIVGQMTIEEIHRDRDKFAEKVAVLAENDMASMGHKIVSIGIKDITDDKGYFEAMAAPHIAAIQRDAKIAQAVAEREARVSAASALQAAEQAELEAKKQILQQQEAFKLREVEMEKQVGLQKATSDMEVQQQTALAVQQQLEAQILMPARANREATEIEAESQRKKSTITAEAEAVAAQTRAEGRAKAVRVEAEANAAATQATGAAEAASLQALKTAEAEGTRQNLLAEAEGRAEIAKATAAEGAINLRQFIIETLAKADVAKTEHIAAAMGQIGHNVKLVQIGNSSSGQTGNSLIDMIMSVPEMATVLDAKVEALSGEGITEKMLKVVQLLSALQAETVDTPATPAAAQEETEA